ncbi:PTPA-CTERM sorting domain-containing protein [Thermogemmatispora sp.]
MPGLSGLAASGSRRRKQPE